MIGIETLAILSIISCSASSAIAFYKTFKYFKKITEKEVAFKEIIDDYVIFMTANENNVLRSYALLGEWYANNSEYVDEFIDTTKNHNKYGNNGDHYKKDKTFFDTIKRDAETMKTLDTGASTNIHHHIMHQATDFNPLMSNITFAIQASNIALVVVSYLVIKLYTSQMEANKKKKLFDIYQKVQSNHRVAKIINREINNKNLVAGFDFVQTVLGLNMMNMPDSEIDSYLSNTNKIIDDVILMNRIINNKIDIINEPPIDITFAINFLQELLTRDDIITIPPLKNKKIKEVVDIDFDREFLKLKLLYQFSITLPKNHRISKYIEGDVSIYVTNQHKKTIKKYLLKKILDIDKSLIVPEKIFAISKFIDILDINNVNIDFKTLRYSTMLAGKEPFLLTYPINKEVVDSLLTICMERLSFTIPFMKFVEIDQKGGNVELCSKSEQKFDHDIFEPLYDLHMSSITSKTKTLENDSDPIRIELKPIFCIKKVYDIFNQIDTVIEIFKYVRRMQATNWAEFIKIYYGSVKNYDNVFKFISNYDNENSAISFIHDLLFMFIIGFLFISRNDNILEIYNQIITPQQKEKKNTKNTQTQNTEMYKIIKQHMMRAKFNKITVQNINEVDAYKKYDELVDILIKFHKLINCENSIIKFFIIKNVGKNSTNKDIFDNQLLISSKPLYKNKDDGNAVLNLYYRTYMKSIMVSPATIKRKIKYLFDNDVSFITPDSADENNEYKLIEHYKDDEYMQAIMNVLYQIMDTKKMYLPDYTISSFTYPHFEFISGLYVSTKLNVHCIETVDSSTVFHLDRFFVPEFQLGNQLLYILNKLMYDYEQKNELKKMYEFDYHSAVSNISNISNYDYGDLFINLLKKYIATEPEHHVSPSMLLNLLELCTENVECYVHKHTKSYSIEALETSITQIPNTASDNTESIKKLMLTDIIINLCNEIIPFDGNNLKELKKILHESHLYKQILQRIHIPQTQIQTQIGGQIKIKKRYKFVS